MAFSKSIKDKALSNSRRCCCICHEFAGLYTNIHHIKPKAKKGPDTLENAIVLCLKCHGEVGHYNKDHPIGNSYSKEELIQHRTNWWEWCKNNPYSPLPSSPVVISPSEISISSGEWSTVSQIDIFNKTDKFLYQVWLKFIINSKIIKPDDIEISLGQNSDDSKLNIGNIELNQQMYKVHASDSKNEDVLYLVIDKLKPKISYQIDLAINPEINAETGDSLTLYISSLSAQPSTKNKKKDESAVSYSFTPPENMKMHSVSLMMNKNDK